MIGRGGLKTLACRESGAPKFWPLLSAIALLGNLIAFGAILSPAVAFGESGFPPCQSGDTASWTGCQGTYAYSDGKTYVGEFHDGKPNGRGTLTYRSDGEYVGEFRDSRPSGQGTYTYPDGRRYVGEWRNGDFNGFGVRTYPDGRKEAGEWSGGKLTGGAASIRSAEEASPLPILSVIFVGAAAIAAAFILQAKRRKSDRLFVAGGTHVDRANRQSEVDAALGALLEAIEDFSVSNARLLELRGNARQAFEQHKSLQRKATARRFLSFLKFW
jgi:hypothetical protein